MRSQWRHADVDHGCELRAGRGDGADANLATVSTNLLARWPADRGLRGAQTAYAASKAGLSTLAEGIRADVAGTAIDVTTLAPGYIESEMTSRTGGGGPLVVDTATGVRAMVGAIDARVAHAYVPGWPWAVLGPLLGVLPMPILRRLT